MKKRLLILTLVIFLTSMLFSQAYESTLPAGEEDKSMSTKVVGNPMVKIAALKYEPYPVEPGYFFDLWLRIDNLGEEEAENVRIVFLPRGPFTIQGSDTETIGELGSLQSAVVKFENIKVSDDAVEGFNELEFEIYMGGVYDIDRLTTKVGVEVRSVEPLFEITISSEPEKIPQGGTAKININLKNKDTSLLKDISVELDLPDELVPIGSTVLKKIQKIGPGGEETLTYTVTASGDAISKAYQIPLTVSYSDEVGFNYSQGDVMGLLIGSEPDYYVNLEESDTFSKNCKGQIVISISNTGPADIKFLTVELLPSDDFITFSNSKTYIGNLEPDDFETAEFEIYVDKEGEIPLELKVEYRDNYNMKHETAHSLKIKSFTKDELKKYGLPCKEPTPPLTIVLYILGIIFLYLLFKNWRKERDIVKAGLKSIGTLIKIPFKIIGMFRWRYLKRIPRKIQLFLAS